MILLFVYLIRVVAWRLFFSGVVASDPMKVSPKSRRPKGGDAVRQARKPWGKDPNPPKFG